MSTHYTFQWEWEKRKVRTSIDYSAKVNLIEPMERSHKMIKLEDSANAPSLTKFKVNVEKIYDDYHNIGIVQILKDQELEWSDLLEKLFDKISKDDIINIEDLPTTSKDLSRLFDHRSHILTNFREPLFQFFYREFVACVKDGFSNGSGEEFGMVLLDLFVGTYLCSLAKTIPQGFKSASTSTEERKKSGDKQSDSLVPSQQQTTSRSKTKRKMVVYYNQNIRYADVILRAHSKILTDHICLLKSVIEVKNNCSHSSVKEAIQQGFNYGICASKESENQRILLCLLTPDDWFLGWLSPIEANVELVSISVFSKNEKTNQCFLSKTKLLWFVRLLESYGKNEFVKDSCQSSWHK